MRPIALLAALSLLLLPPADARAADADDAGASPPLPAWLADLPAVSDDGSVLAVANRQSSGHDGLEWNEHGARLLLDFIDVASDRLVRRIIVSDAYYPRSSAGGEAKARAVLAERTWVKLRKPELLGLEVHYREPALAVRDKTSSADLVRKKEPTWSHPGGSLCPGCEVCPAPVASLADAWVDRLHGVLLVNVSFTGGGDACWQPPDEFHAVELPPTIPHP